MAALETLYSAGVAAPNVSNSRAEGTGRVAGGRPPEQGAPRRRALGTLGTEPPGPEAEATAIASAAAAIPSSTMGGGPNVQEGRRERERADTTEAKPALRAGTASSPNCTAVQRGATTLAKDNKSSPGGSGRVSSVASEPSDPECGT